MGGGHPEAGHGAPPAHRGGRGPIQTTRSDRRTRDRQPQEDHRQILPTRTQSSSQRTAPCGNGIQPHEDSPISPYRLTLKAPPAQQIQLAPRPRPATDPTLAPLRRNSATGSAVVKTINIELDDPNDVVA